MTLGLLLLAVRGPTGCAWITPEHHADRVADLDGDGFRAADGDCDDGDAAVNPGAGDLDCDGFTDSEGDCDDADPEINPAVGDLDCDGYPEDQDCDDADATIHPDQLDLSCEDGDINCDGFEADTLYYPDADGDGFGDVGAAGDCLNATGSVYSHDDCDDSDPDAWPGAPERCDQKFNDCALETTWSAADEEGVVSLSVAGSWDDTEDLTSVFGSGFDGEGGTVTYTLPVAGTLTLCPATYFVRLVDDPSGSVVDVVAPYGSENPTTLDANNTYNVGSTVWLKSAASAVSLHDLYIAGAKDTETGIAGSGVRVEAGSVDIEGCTIQGNYGSQGGGIYNSGVVTMDHSTLANNIATGDGGGIYNDFDATLTVSESVISGNTASNTGTGGGLMAVGGTSDITDSEITLNYTYGGDGGGVALAFDAVATLTRVTVDGNFVARTNGGGASVTGDATLVVVGSSGTVANYGFTNNTTQDLGGGVYISGETASLRCTYCDFAGNITGDVYAAAGGEWTAPDSGLDWNGTCDQAGCQ